MTTRGERQGARSV